MNECRPLLPEEYTAFAPVFERLGFLCKDNISRFVDTRLDKVYDVFLLGEDTVLKKSGKDKEKYDLYFKGKGFAVPAILDECMIDGEVWCTMPYINGTDARNCTPEQAAYIGRELARIQSHYLTCGGNTESAQRYWEKYTGKYCEKVMNYFPEYANVFQMVKQRFLEAPRTLLHDDFLPINVLIAENKPWIIDWEMAGIYPYFLDLARFSFIYNEKNELFIGKKARKAFLEDYYSEMYQNPSFSEDRETFYRDAAISAFCQYVMFVYYIEDAGQIHTNQDYQYLKEIIIHLNKSLT